MTEYEKQVKARLMAAINNSAVSLAELSRTDIPYTTIQGYAGGVLPTAARLGILCKALGIPAGWILGLDTEQPSR